MKASGLFAGLVAATALLGAGAAHAAAAGSADAGKLVFDMNCLICHSNAQGAAHKIGPNLFGVVGKNSAAATGYTYSAAMQNANVTWNEETLRTYLAAPARMIPGTKMGFPGFSDPQDEANLLAYLATLK